MLKGIIHKLRHLVSSNSHRVSFTIVYTSLTWPKDGNIAEDVVSAIEEFLRHFPHIDPKDVTVIVRYIDDEGGSKDSKVTAIGALEDLDKVSLVKLLMSQSPLIRQTVKDIFGGTRHVKSI